MILPWVLALSLFVAGCGNAAAGGEDQLQIVATTSVWGDVVSQIVDEDATVDVLIPTGADSHDYEPTSRQVASLREADLVIANGLGLEEAIEEILENAESDGVNVYRVGPDLDPLPFASDGGRDADHEEASDEDDGHGTNDPHVWFDPLRVATAAGLIAEQLDQIDPSVDWAARAAAYAADLEEADTEIVATLAAVPEARRMLVTNHDAFGYFADRYGFEVIGVVIPGGSTMGDPSSADMAALVSEIEREGVPAIFAETTRPSRLAESVAAEVGSDVAVVELYTESLGEPGSGAETLIGMLVTNAGLIAESMS